MGDELNATEQTAKFHESVIESTIEALRERSNASDFSDDLLDRLKAAWERNLAAD